MKMKILLINQKNIDDLMALLNLNKTPKEYLNNSRF